VPIPAAPGISSGASSAYLRIATTPPPTKEKATARVAFSFVGKVRLRIQPAIRQLPIQQFLKFPGRDGSTEIVALGDLAVLLT